MKPQPTMLYLTRRGNQTYLLGDRTAREVRVGSVGDNLVHALQFVRDPEYQDNLLVLYIGGEVISLGLGNSYVIPDTITNRGTQAAEVALLNPDGVEKERSTQITLVFRGERIFGSAPDPPLPSDLIDKAFTAVGADGDDAVFFNGFGQERGRIAMGSGGGDKTYRHDQVASAAEWQIYHNLGKRPSVTIVDTAGTVVYGDVAHVSGNLAIARFSAPFAGSAYCN